ncbi:TetR/AcrR family transcriptional regulator [Pantoea allii]|uniref:TetR/AcrR family transcriptional regulator n=1 Tax=Pantoea allii TaxID=574096 RepID=UPI000A262783|nr:TetR/AcrR family transcriptional regulator [Pantoea allii]MBW1253704.1 TetR/AcrR family transcriptional regulator [Pantoea allii]MBW1262827.1 TetR/AcrR family transcriptional regulator [Pantoea allii]MBW1285384.1 TetR/AcrR family transcriptional regulator [Pantoea allii]ORM82890.1 TetR family transcriptional regulator [Pantoea allii]PBJ97796.1 TetR family transcriptional regulator [Pantoea allii]
MKPSSHTGSAQSSAGRPRAFNEEQFLDGAISLFRDRGFSGVSISDITAATNLSTGSVYKAYKDKQGVFAMALERYVFLREEQIKTRLEKAATSKDKLAELLRDYVELSQGKDGKLGCMVVAGVTSFDQLGAAASSLEKQLAKRRSNIAELIKNGKQDGSIAATTNETAAAEVILALLQGMRVIGKASTLTQDTERFVAQALKVLE